MLSNCNRNIYGVLSRLSGVEMLIIGALMIAKIISVDICLRRAFYYACDLPFIWRHTKVMFDGVWGLTLSFQRLFSVCLRKLEGFLNFWKTIRKGYQNQYAIVEQNFPWNIVQNWPFRGELLALFYRLPTWVQGGDEEEGARRSTLVQFSQLCSQFHLRLFFARFTSVHCFCVFLSITWLIDWEIGASLRILLLLLLLHVMLSTEVPEHSNCRLVPYWREFLGVSGSRTWSDTPFANT